MAMQMFHPDSTQATTLLLAVYSTHQQHHDLEIFQLHDVLLQSHVTPTGYTYLEPTSLY